MSPADRSPLPRFLLNRLTPGNLGLELTAMLAVLSVATFVVIGYAGIVAADPGPTTGDQAAFDVAANVAADWLTDAAKAITWFGSAAATLAVALIAAAVLGARRRWALVAVLVASMAILYLAVPVMKEAIDRPRPGGGLVDVTGDSYPSGHAAYAVLYGWLAVTTALLWRARIRGSGLIIAGVAVAAAIGLSRVYLHVHYMSDVAGGWALGVTAFTACSIVALVAVHLRDNPDP